MATAPRKMADHLGEIIANLSIIVSFIIVDSDSLNVFLQGSHYTLADFLITSGVLLHLSQLVDDWWCAPPTCNA